MVVTETAAATQVPPPADSALALAVLERAVERISAGFPAEALDDLRRLSEGNPGWAVARAYYGTALHGVARIAEARDLLESAVAMAPDSFICRLRYAEFLARNGFYDQAAVQLDAALHLPVPDAGARDAAIMLRAFCRQKARGMFYRETPNLRARLRPLLSRLAVRGRVPALITVTTER